MAFFKLLKVFLILSLLQYGSGKTAPYGCGPGVNTSGYTYPLGDITLRLGQSLEILCVLNEDAAAKYGPNGSQYMRYVMRNHNFSVDIVNSTAIKLHIENHPKTSYSDYFCMIGDSLVCHNVVVVGTPPQDVTDFDCIGHNYENFTCSWTAPKNYVLTDYELEYTPTYRPARYYKTHHKSKAKPKGTTSPRAKCPTNLTIKEIYGKTTMSCTWALGTKPQYRHSHDNFTFKLFANNTFGNRTWEFPIRHYTRVRPSPPEDLQAMGTSPHSIKLRWNIPLYMQSYPPGLEHRISWFIQQTKKWTTVYLKDIKADQTVEYELENLPYAHCLYDIRVSMKSAKATEERMWSQNTSATVRTLSKIPDCPPNTTVGSFELLEGKASRLVYWKNIHNYQENGENFSYYIQLEENPAIQPVKVSNNYAEFENLPDRNYTFRIWSKNSVGNSNESSVVFFPAKKYALRQLSKLVKVDKGNGEYDLEWTESSDPVANYTLFWCSAQKERPYTCDGTVQWETVARGVKNKTLKLATYNQEKSETINIYQFAISANGYGTSSGLLWADCTVIPGTGVKLRQTYVKKVSPRYIVLQWKLECIKLGDIQSFNVSYCTIATPLYQECQPNSTKFKLFDNITFRKGEGELNITGLKPYTGYKIQVKPIVIGAESQFSDPMFNTTYEDTPTEPRDLVVRQRSDRTISIQWEKPLEENGHLRHYIIFVNGREEIRVSPEKEKNIYKATLDHLLPRNNYTIHVMACIHTCSNSSVHTSTDIGYPGTIPKPSANWDNYSLIIKWDKPDEIGVEVDFYEVQVGTTKGREDFYIHNTTDQYFKISICQHDKTQTVYVKIRAVNIRDGRLLQGNWSEKADFPCFRSPSSSSWIILLVVMSVIVFIALMCYLVKRVWRKILGMRNCPVKLPPGLDAVVNDFEPKEKHSDETLPGEPLLPEKFPKQIRNPSGETSGCCSGTESVASSIESAGHLSMSDSGTEQPRSPSLGDSENRDVSLRQRPNVKKPDYLTMTEIPQAPWSTKPIQSGYSVIGLSAPPKKSELESEYMPLSEIPAKTSYVPFPLAQSQDPIKEPAARVPTSGYVPYLPQEPASKNTAYVLAGEPISAKPATKLALKASTYTQKEDNSSGYVKAPPMEVQKLSFPWQQHAPLEPPSTGYVVVGDTKPPKADLGVQKGSNKGYVPHNLKFETTKSLKED